jgi:hypothetical protein
MGVIGAEVAQFLSLAAPQGATIRQTVARLTSAFLLAAA